MPTFVKTAERRKSERVLLSIPVHLSGKDRQGKDFFENTSTVIVGRSGALVRSKHDMSPESTIKIVNPRNDRSAEFRVVMKRGSPEGGEAHWGVECLDVSKNIWGIDFPPPIPPEDPSAGALLRCDRCTAFVFTKLAGIAYDLIDVPGAVQRFCDKCQIVTSWTLSEYRPQEEAQAAGVSVAPGQRSPAAPQGITDTGKRAARVLVKMRLRLRDSQGKTEISRAENISRTGVCFISERDYPVGTMLMIAMGYTEGASSIESLARVVRQQSMPNSPRKIYGLKFER